MSDALVLCYHALSERWPAALAVTPARFESQLEGLLRRGYRGATFHDAVRSPPSGRTLAVTFDDAYRSVIELALPIMSRLGVPGTVFVPTAFAGADAPMAWPGVDRWLATEHEAELVPMSWQELGALAAAGWEIGSHTRTHPRLTELDDVALAAELRGSRRDLESRLGLPCRSLAYPYGDEDARVVRAAGQAGYEAAGALPFPLPHAPSPLRWPRVGIDRVDRGWRFRRKVSPLVRRLRTTRPWKIVNARPRLR
jgi:peptidoglycan/xylan/chitin deacetylase (PgdA/CDA1 family)